MDGEVAAEVMPERSPTMEFVLDELRKDPAISFGDVRDRAALRGLTIYPVVYGRAKGLLGLVPTLPRGQGKQARAAAAKREIEHGPVERAAEPMRAELAEPTAEPLPELSPEQPAAHPTSVAPVRPRRRRQQAKARTAGLAGERLEDALGEMLRIAEERDRYRAVLEEIRRTLDEALE